jgi:hypothetical protein
VLTASINRAQHPRRRSSWYSSQWKPEISPRYPFFQDCFVLKSWCQNYFWSKIKLYRSLMAVKISMLPFLGRDAAWPYTWILTFQRNILPPSSGLKYWRWVQYVPTERWYLPTSSHGVASQKTNMGGCKWSWNGCFKCRCETSPSVPSWGSHSVCPARSQCFDLKITVGSG